MSDSVQSFVRVPAFGGNSLSAWNHSARKRGFDLILACPLLVVLSPLLVVIALLVKVSSVGPVFFRQQRVGKDGRLFRLIKFRTMIHQANSSGPKITRAGDHRVTSLGAILRKWKLDELPQLFNVIRGDMSFVGPRPDVPEYVAGLPPPQSDILRVRPGVTGMASLRYHNEEQLLRDIASGELPEFYCTHLLIDKARIDLEYAQRAGFFSDVGVIVRTLMAMLS